MAWTPECPAKAVNGDATVASALFTKPKPTIRIVPGIWKASENGGCFRPKFPFEMWLQ